MNPDVLLVVLAALAGFLLKTTIAFALCLALSWLAGSPARRCTVWLTFLYGSAAYWLWTAHEFLANRQTPTSPVAVPHLQVTSAVGALQIPGSWAVAMGVTSRVIGSAYLLALTCILFTHLKKHQQLKWVLRFTTKPPAEIANLFQSLAQGLRVGRSRLLLLSGVASPATFGWIRPVILLPDMCLQQDRSELEDILCHELHHVRRLDFVWNGLAVISRALLFFHPAAWYAVRKIQFDRELACDLAVVANSPARRAKYAECLIHFARLNASQDPRAWGLDFAASSEHLKARVESVLVGSTTNSRWIFGLRIVSSLTLLAAFVCVAPSLAILLSYAHQETSHPLAPVPAPLQRAVGMLVPGRHKLALSGATARPSRDRDAANVNQAAAAPSSETSPAGEQSDLGRSATSTDSGPQLLRRSSSPLAGHSPQDAKRQSVVFSDSEADQVTRDGHRDKAQAAQQAATAAAGILRRLGEVDRH